jgi:hypothetical protein
MTARRRAVDLNIKPCTLPRNTLLLDPEQLQQLYAACGRHGNSEEVQRREHARWPYQVTSISAEFRQPGGGATLVCLAARDLSEVGIGLWHRSFVYPRSACRIWLPTLTGSVAELPGYVARCEHIRAAIHEIGVRFDHPVVVSEFLASGLREPYSASDGRM